MNEHGIIKTTFDILARNEIPIKTYLAGNAVSVVMQKNDDIQKNNLNRLLTQEKRKNET